MLGLGLPKDVLEEPQLFVVKAVDLRQRLERCYQRHYINMDRQRFDHWLLSMVPSTVDIRTGCRFVSYSRIDGGFMLPLHHRDNSVTEGARILVGAGGSNSRVRRLLLPARPCSVRYIAIQEWVEKDHNLPYFTSLFDPDITDYYGWTIPKANHLLIGVALRPGLKGFERRYRDEMRALRANVLLKNWKRRVVFNPTLRKAVMRSGVQSVKMAAP